VRHKLFEQFNPFPAHCIFLGGKASDVTAWPGQALDIAGAHRIGHDREHDRNSAGRLSQRRHRGAGKGHDDVRLQRDQFHCGFASAIGTAGGPAVVDPHVAAVDPTQLLQSLQERRDASLGYRMVLAERHEHANAPHPLRLLRPCRERPRCRAAEQRDELAPSRVEHGLPLRSRSAARSAYHRPAGRSLRV
jgi:hypothetical protein